MGILLLAFNKNICQVIHRRSGTEEYLSPLASMLGADQRINLVIDPVSRADLLGDMEMLLLDKFMHLWEEGKIKTRTLS